MSTGRGRTLRGDRLHIGFFGRRNAGKSSLINAVTNQAAAIVSEVPGTTTDPVFKPMELHPLGPVVLIDTAGLDDGGDPLGTLRKERTVAVLKKTDLALLIVDGNSTDFAFEDGLVQEFENEHIPYLIVLNKVDMQMSPETDTWLLGKTHMRVSSKERTGIDELKKKIAEIAPQEWEPPFMRDLVHPGDVIILVVPIDLGAPKGRLIMPQVKALRDVLDAGGIAMMCRESELALTLQKLNQKPALVVTDSQAFTQVAAAVPLEVALTSFSILSARQKGDLDELVKGVDAVESLKPGDRVLVAEYCTHHPQEDDIGRKKIPRWLNEHIAGELRFDTVVSSDFPADLRDYQLVVHCGACTANRKEIVGRIKQAAQQGVPITNYGVLISYLKGVFPRALEPLKMPMRT
jgi:[FeFe] hydrogenase H-cluster maturation GTPase HydF